MYLCRVWSFTDWTTPCTLPMLISNDALDVSPY
jgi:hypothetical protein